MVSMHQHGVIGPRALNGYAPMVPSALKIGKNVPIR